MSILLIRILRTGFMVLLSLSVLLPARAQPEDLYHITWLGEYPGEKGGRSQSFSDRVSRIVFGQKPREVIKPFNVVAANPELFWILDQGAGGVFEVKGNQGAMIRSFKKAGKQFPSMVGICRLSGKDLLFTDSSLDRVLRVAGDEVLDFCDSVSLEQPTGISCNSATGDIWVVETGAHRISRFNSKGHLIGRIGGRGTEPGLFNFPTFIWIDRDGRIYIVDSMNYRIQIMDAEGAFLASFGESGDATGYMARPKGIATDSQGHIYVADALFHAVQIFDRDGNFLYSFGSQGQGAGDFWMPAGIFIDEEDHIYVADSYNARVQIFQLEKND
jgi:DNA-binding beta-propeller fold protein YncE